MAILDWSHYSPSATQSCASVTCSLDCRILGFVGTVWIPQQAMMRDLLSGCSANTLTALRRHRSTLCGEIQDLCRYTASWQHCFLNQFPALVFTLIVYWDYFDYRRLFESKQFARVLYCTWYYLVPKLCLGTYRTISSQHISTCTPWYPSIIIRTEYRN